MAWIKDYISKSVNFIDTSIKKLKEKKEKEIKELRSIDKKIQHISDELAQKNGELDHIFTPRNYFLFWTSGALVVYVSYVIFQSLEILYLIIASYILSIAIESIINFFIKMGMERPWSIVISYLLAFIFLLSGFVFVVPFVLKQINEILNITVIWFSNLQILLQEHGLQYIIEEYLYLPSTLKDILIDSITSWSLVNNIQQAFQQNLSQIISTGTDYAKNIGDVTVTIIAWFFTTIFKIFLVITLSILFSIEKDGIIEFIAGFAGDQKEYVKIKLIKIYKKLGMWLKGQIFLCIYIGLIVWFGLWIIAAFGMNIPQKGSLAIIAGITEFLPYIGPLLWSIPAIMIATLTFWFPWFIVIVILYSIIQRTENNIIIPIVMHKTLGVSALVIFISMLIGGLVLWFVGVLLAVPIAVIATMIFDDDFH